MTAPEPWEVLSGAVREALKTSPPSWFEIWRLFLEDPWYQAELAKHARLVLRVSGAPGQWLEDVQQEAMLILAGKLQKQPDLGLDEEGLGELFPASIGTIARNHCRQALKRLRRIYRSGSRLLEELDSGKVVGFYERQQQLLEVSAAVDELPEPLCSVIRLFQLGFDLPAIAERLGLTYWQAYRAFWRGVERIRDDLDLL